MPEKNIYVEGLGWRNPIKEFGQILWFFEQTSLTKPKSHATRYWLDIMERHGEKLLKMQAYELYGAIKKRATDEKIIRRNNARAKAKEKAIAEGEAFKEWYRHKKAMHDLIKSIGLN
jgi:hypothetical protein